MGLGAFDAILVLVSTSGFLLNAYVLLIALGLNKQTQQLQTANTALLLIHLSIVESVICLAFILFTTGGWPLTESWCILHGFLFSLLHPIALWTVTGLNCDRYYAISAPLHYTGIVSRRRVIIGLTSSWLFSLLLCLPTLSGLVPSYKYSPDFGCCVPDFGNGKLWSTASVVYAAIYVLLGLILPIFLVTLCNLRILGIARYHRHRIASAIYEVTLSAQVTITHQRNPFYVPTITSPSAGGPPRFHSAASTVIQLIGPLYLLYLPYCGLILWEACSVVILSQSGPKVHLWIASLASLLLAISPLINGILYGVKSRTLRRTFQNYRRKKVTKSELEQEIQARTPSAAGSRRASGSGPVSLFPFPPPQRRLSEALLYLGRNPRDLPFESHENLMNFNRSRLQFASCNTLQVPNSEGVETRNKLVRTSASAASLMDHAYQSETLKLKQDDIYPSDSSKRSPRILITRTYSVESLEKRGGNPLLKHNCVPGNSSNKTNKKRKKRHMSIESDSSTGSSDVSVWTTKIATHGDSVNFKNSVNNWPVGRQFTNVKTLEEGAMLFTGIKISNNSENSHNVGTTIAITTTTATTLPPILPFNTPMFSMKGTKYKDTMANEAKVEENPCGTESSWPGVEDNDVELNEYNDGTIIQAANGTEGKTMEEADFTEPTQCAKRGKEKR